MSTFEDPLDDLDFGFKPPASAPGLLTAMQSAAAYAELAVLTGSWEPNDIERGIYGRDWNKTGNDKLRGTFRGTRDGATIHASQVEKILTRFPASQLPWWQRHPIAQILCDASLGQDGVLAALRMLPNSSERQCVWHDYMGPFTRTAFLRELPDSDDVIHRLSNFRTPLGLLALIGRMRLAQLRGATGGIDVKYERALLQMLPDCISSSPHLFLGRDALLEAVWRFLNWSPHAEARFLLSSSSSPDENFRERYSESITKASWPEVSLPPEDQMQSRGRRVAEIVQLLS